jgi:uncharacterized protein (TIGR01244 family)
MLMTRQGDEKLQFIDHSDCSSRPTLTTIRRNRQGFSKLPGYGFDGVLLYDVCNNHTLQGHKMDIRQIDEGYAVTGQISPDDVRDIAAEGYQAIICNRPDGESPDQPDFAEVAKVAEKAGIPIYYVPVVSGQLTQDDVDAMASALEASEGPVLAYCRSGARSTNIYGIVQQQKG